MFLLVCHFLKLKHSISKSTSASDRACGQTRAISSSAFSSSVLSSRDTCVGPRADGDPFPLQSLCSGGRGCPSEGGLELCILAER